jgi:hypothetical protein
MTELFYSEGEIGSMDLAAAAMSVDEALAELDLGPAGWTVRRRDHDLRPRHPAAEVAGDQSAAPARLDGRIPRRRCQRRCEEVLGVSRRAGESKTQQAR